MRCAVIMTASAESSGKPLSSEIFTENCGWCSANVVVAATGGSSRASRFAAWKNGLSAFELSMPAAAWVIRTPVQNRLAVRVCRSPVANQGRRRATLRGRFICSRSRRSQVGASRAACYGDDNIRGDEERCILASPCLRESFNRFRYHEVRGCSSGACATGCIASIQARDQNVRSARSLMGSLR